MRDGYSGYLYFDQAAHVWCGAHTLRDIKLLHDADPAGRSGLAMMRDALLMMLRATHRAQNQHADRLDQTDTDLYRGCYHGAIHEIRADNAGRQDPIAQAARTLATRFETHEAMILRFIGDLAVPFTNNRAEQEIRPVKIHQRAQGGAWRTLAGLAEFATVYSYLTTAAKHGIDQIKALTILFEGHPWMPPQARRLTIPRQRRFALPPPSARSSSVAQRAAGHRSPRACRNAVSQFAAASGVNSPSSSGVASANRKSLSTPSAPGSRPTSSRPSNASAHARRSAPVATPRARRAMARNPSARVKVTNSRSLSQGNIAIAAAACATGTLNSTRSRSTLARCRSKSFTATSCP